MLGLNRNTLRKKLRSWTSGGAGTARDRACAAERRADAPGRRVSEALLGRGMTIALAVCAVLLGSATFVMLAGGSPLGPTRPGRSSARARQCGRAAAADGLPGRATRANLGERRRGGAGSRLHVRMVVLFRRRRRGALAHRRGLRRSVLQPRHPGLVQRPRALDPGGKRRCLPRLPRPARDEIRVDALAMAADLNRAAQVFLPDNMPAFERLLAPSLDARIRGGGVRATLGRSWRWPASVAAACGSAAGLGAGAGRGGDSRCPGGR
jgi:two-component system nitrogen regulation sensor histidine kinase NtrY